MDEDQAVSAAVVLQSMSSVEERVSARKSGSLGEPGKSFDELFDWILGDNGVRYYKKRPETFEYYIQKVFGAKLRPKGQPVIWTLDGTERQLRQQMHNSLMLVESTTCTRTTI